VKVKATSGLSNDDVERIIGDADRFKMADELRKELAELRNQAETLLYTTEAALEGYQDLVDGVMIEGASESCKRLRALLEAGGDLTNIRSSYQELETLTFKIAESLYGGA
jgi:molecular chaperone DnaK